MKIPALTLPFSMIMNRMWPRAVTAEIRLYAVAGACRLDNGCFALRSPCPARHDDRSGYARHPQNRFRLSPFAPRL